MDWLKRNAEPSHKEDTWEGNYDETKVWHCIGENGIAYDGRTEKDNIIFVNGSIYDQDCFLVKNNHYDTINNLHIRFCYSSDCEPISIYDDYKKLLNVEEFKNATIIGRKRWDNEYSYYIVSKKEKELYQNYKENPYEYIVDEKTVFHKDYSHLLNTSLIVGAGDIIPVSAAGLEINTCIERDCLYKTEHTIKVVKQELLEKDFILTNPCSEKHKLMNHFYTPILGRWFKKSDWEKMVEKLKKPHDPYVIKGTNKPPYFKIDDYIVEANTPSWYEFILIYYFDSKVQDWMLEKM
ncbi:MAG: hypothetical protein IKK93_07020 [Campylobacter sp.]|nr:hypothetical protein [Campylobacter sp.]